jgi:hypothetical protein
MSSSSRIVLILYGSVEKFSSFFLVPTIFSVSYQPIPGYTIMLSVIPDWQNYDFMPKYREKFAEGIHTLSAVSNLIE